MTNFSIAAIMNSAKATTINGGQRRPSEETSNYKIKNGKIIYVQYIYIVMIYSWIANCIFLKTIKKRNFMIISFKSATRYLKKKFERQF